MIYRTYGISKYKQLSPTIFSISFKQPVIFQRWQRWVSEELGRRLMCNEWQGAVVWQLQCTLDKQVSVICNHYRLWYFDVGQSLFRRQCSCLCLQCSLCPLTSRTRKHARTLCRCAFNDNTCVFYTDLSIDRRNLIQPVGEKPPHKEWVNIQNPARGVTKCVNEAVNSVVQLMLLKVVILWFVF